MKRIVAIILAVLVVAGLAACGKDAGGGASGTSGSSGAAGEVAATGDALTEEEIADMFLYPDNYKGRSVVKLPAKVGYSTDFGDGKTRYSFYMDDMYNNSIFCIVPKDVKLAESQYVYITGVVQGVFTYPDGTASSPEQALIEASEVEVTDENVFNPKLSEVVVDQSKTKEDVTVTIDKVELAKETTRVYLTVNNGSDAAVRVSTYSGSFIQQGNKQYDIDSSNYSYQETTMPNEINPGIESEGAIAFDALANLDDPFKITIEVSSSDYSIQIEPFVFAVPYDPSLDVVVEDPSVAVGQTREEGGVTMSVEKVVLTADCTVVYVKLKNGTEEDIHYSSFDSYIVQGSHQYEYTYYRGKETELQTELHPGIESEGVIAFDPIATVDESFTITLQVRSSDYSITYDPFVYEVEANPTLETTGEAI